MLLLFRLVIQGPKMPFYRKVRVTKAWRQIHELAKNPDDALAAFDEAINVQLKAMSEKLKYFQFCVFKCK